MRNAITPNRVANSILIKRKSMNKVIIVEGTHDLLFFSKFKHSESQIEIAFGWENVINVVNSLLKEGYDNCIGIIDTDLKPIIPESYIIPANVFTTDCHDINIETIEYSFDIIYNHYCSKEKDKKFKEDNQLNDIKTYIYSLALPISFLRILSKRNSYNLRFKCKDEEGNSLDFTKFIDKDKFKFINIEKLVEAVMNYSRNKIKTDIPTKDIIVAELNQLIEQENDTYDRNKITNGHDFGEIILVGLKRKLGNNQHIKSDDFLKDCILNYEFVEFQKTKLFQQIKRFEATNTIEYLKN
ncbi:hypothetical protein D1631_15440 [Chryseobacterium nematophagum]|uniref:DUF4435 domain-containing protein n=1 Tax=Chryseobacterium nematophagum TaxID=2305228 RepID=A0A3M7TI37_9FLAO|nr:hypothetical protein [Chryseobacterium nematophagum]RNA63222.1 hypothetical protein D1631_15440 [Chryseobacterium nematophagum]